MKPPPRPFRPPPAGSSERAVLEAAVLAGEQRAPARNAAAPPGAWTILVVDDDDDTRVYVVHCLEGAALPRPVHVVEAADGEAALRCLRAQAVDLVVTDVHMPGLDGAGLAAALAADAALATLPVLFLSGDAEAGRALATPPRRFLLKPFNRKRLVEAVRALLGPSGPV